MNKDNYYCGYVLKDANFNRFVMIQNKFNLNFNIYLEYNIAQ